MIRRSSAALVGLAALLAGCSPSAALPDDVTVAAGWSVDVVRDDLQRPTQLAFGPAGATVYVAELAGGEDAGQGRVLDIGRDATGDPVVLLEELLTPTGFAVPDESTLFVQEQETLSAVELDSVRAGDLVGDGFDVLAEGLPFNGRSQGTLSLVGGEDGQRLLATATGSGSGPDVPEGSGRLYAPGLDGGEEATVAVGFKNAYAHAVGPDDQLYVTEIGDGTYDGEAPVDELNVIPTAVWQAALDGTGEPFDGGWPRCTGDGDPTEEFGATADECAGLPAPVATFPPRSTPTSVAVTSDGTVLVALWVEGRVVEVDPDTGEVTDVVTGLDGPQHLLARDDGSVLLTVHGSGHLLALRPSDAS